MEETNDSSEEYYNYYNYDYDFIRMTPTFRIVSAIFISVLILLAISGNTITIIAYITDKRLHTVYDFFIFNLAATDLLIGCISMPFYAVYTLREFVWEFGDIFCKIWNVMDFTLCLESILLMLMLSFDRLCLVKYGPFYSSKVTKKRAMLLVILSWIISFLLYGPAIIGWNFWVGYTTLEPLDCDVEFAYNVMYTTTTAIIEFVIPVVGLAIMNTLIFRHIKRRIVNSNKINPKPNTTSTVPTDDNALSLNRKILHVNVNQINTLENKPKNGSSLNIPNGPTIEVNDKDTATQEEDENKESDSIFADGKADTVLKNVVNENVSFTSDIFQNRISFVVIPHHRSSFLGTLGRKLRRKPKNRNEHSRIKKDSKAARFLAILVLVFLTCWAPYTITTIIVSFCGENCINTSVYECMNWLLWSKSAINPFLYAINSTRYRYHFKKYVFCCKNQVYPNDTETTCQTAG